MANTLGDYNAPNDSFGKDSMLFRDSSEETPTLLKSPMRINAIVWWTTLFMCALPNSHAAAVSHIDESDITGETFIAQNPENHLTKKCSGSEIATFLPPVASFEYICL